MYLDVDPTFKPFFVSIDSHPDTCMGKGGTNGKQIGKLVDAALFFVFL